MHVISHEPWADIMVSPKSQSSAEPLSPSCRIEVLEADNKKTFRVQNAAGTPRRATIMGLAILAAFAPQSMLALLRRRPTALTLEPYAKLSMATDPARGSLQALAIPKTSHVGCVEQAGSLPCIPAILPPKPLKGYLAACLIIRDDPDFPEWLSYHRRLGVEAFYIFDHNSTTPLQQLMPDDSLKRGDVRYQYINDFPDADDTCPQMAVFHECLQIAQHHPWVAFIDVDEYIVPSPGMQYIPDFLRRAEGHCALTLNWRVLGSSNHTRRPLGGVLENYTKCTTRDNHLSWWTKVVANPKLVIDFMYVENSDLQGPHKVACRNDTTMVDEAMQPYNVTVYQPVLTERLSLYHFMIRSREDYAIQMARGSSSGDLRDFAYFDWVDGQTDEDCFGARNMTRFMG